MQNRRGKISRNERRLHANNTQKSGDLHANKSQMSDGIAVAHLCISASLPRPFRECPRRVRVFTLRGTS